MCLYIFLHVLRCIACMLYFSLRYTGCGWITLNEGGGSWEVRVKGDLTPRTDGRINSSPITTIPPVVRLHRGVPHTITIPGERTTTICYIGYTHIH